MTYLTPATSDDYMRMRILPVVCVLFALTDLGYAQATDTIVIGSTYSIDSKVLNETRAYWVSLPDSYDLESGSHKTYPLLIVLDAASLFRSVSGALSFMSASRNGSRRVPQMIVVGVVSTNRERDFTPDKIVTRRENQTGGADRFLEFLETELIPVIDDSLRVSSFRVLVGHSLGGLLASHAYLKAESPFDAFIAIDPSFGTWDSATMDEKISAVTPASYDRYLYIATANWGTRNLRNRDRHVRFYESLHRGVDSGPFRATLDYFEDENHGSVPLIAFYHGMSALFEGYGMSFRDVISLEQLTSHYASISERLSHTFKPPEELVNRAGYFLLGQDDAKQRAVALELFEWNAMNYPESFNAFDSLGDAYHSLGEKKKSIESYRRSLALNPGNEHARTQLRRLMRQ